MVMESPDEIESRIQRLNRLGECILLDVRWLFQGTTIAMLFNYIWDSDGNVRSDLGSSECVLEVRFHGVNRFHVTNALSASMVQNIDRINWGLSEIALMKVDGIELSDVFGDAIEFVRILVLWEGERRIEIACRAVEFIGPE